ncbi:uncharacterized protein LOC129756309 isoform X2 [Uranotaenia lowii]|nr:uncharacterized protein LOC129756309 isoform X2 [Uranotaenia lowii]
MVFTFSLVALQESFNQNCFMGASLEFVNNKTIQANTGDENAKPALNNTHRSTDEKVVYIINEYDTNWSSHNYCEYLTYTPLFHALIGVIWFAIFIMHGPGGEGIGSIIDRPWRIVLPSLVFFVSCSISATVCACLTKRGLSSFCQQFEKVNLHEKYSCARMISKYSLHQPNDLVLPDKNYYLVLYFPWIWVAFYYVGVMILLLRIVMVVDFHLVRVIISSVDRDESENENQSLEVSDDIDEPNVIDTVDEKPIITVF